MKCLFLLVLLGQYALIEQSVKPASDEPDWVPCEQYLWNLAEAGGVHFTIEYEPATGLPIIETRHLIELKNKVTREFLMQQVRTNLPNFVITTNSWLTNVFHLRQNSKEAKGTGPLTARASIKYTGCLTGYKYMNEAGQTVSNGIGLVQTLAKQVPGLSFSRAVDWRESWINDAVTIVSVDATNQRVFDIITTCLPVSEYRPILWRAQRIERKGTIETEIRFYGRNDNTLERRKPSQR